MSTDYSITLRRAQTHWQWFLIDDSESHHEPPAAMGRAKSVDEAALEACCAMDRQLMKDELP